MTRETDLIDVWFDSGAMPYAQMHYPFAMKDDRNSGSITRPISLPRGLTRRADGFSPCMPLP